MMRVAALLGAIGFFACGPGRREDTGDNSKPDAMKPAAHAEMFIQNDKSSYEILSKGVLSRKMMPILLKLAPGSKTNIEEYKSGSERFVFVFEGKIEVRVEKEKYTLERNNTLHFDAALPHQFINVGRVTARVLSVLTPVSL